MPTSRAGLTLIELLVSLVLMALGAAGLVAALTADQRLRTIATIQTQAAAQVRDRLELLAARPCAADTAGALAAPWGTDHWHAVANAGAWQFTDSFLPARSAAPLVVEARVACPD